MESSPSQDLGLTDTHDTLSTLDYIVHFLHTEGFYAAEEALLREIENRYPEGEDALQGTGASPSGRSEVTATPEDSNAVFASGDLAEQSSSAGDWQQTLEVIQSAPARRQNQQSFDSASQQPPAFSGQQQHNEKTHNSDSDEYSDDEDPGYSRQDIRGQEAFISRELDLSDDEGSHRGPLSFQSPSPAVHPSSSSGQASSYMAEPPGTSVYDSEAPSEQSHSTSHHPDSSSIHMSQPFNLTLRPDPTILGTAEANTAAASNQDKSRTEQSSASSASFTDTDKSRTDVPDEAYLGASDVHAEASNEQLSQPSISHQTSGIRYLLDGVFEKVSDAFTRHSPRSAPRPTDVSDPTEEPDDEEDGKSQAGADLPMIHSGNVGISHPLNTPSKAQSSLGDGDSENFSFPVTPPSEPVPAGPVFGHGFGRASSGVSHGESEYTTDGRDSHPSPAGTSRSDVSPQQLTAGSERRRHRSLIDVIQDLEQENAAEIASSGVSPASDRPVPLDLSGAISEPMPIPGTSGQHAQGQALEQPPALPPGMPHHLRPSDDGSEPVPCPPGLEVIPDLEVPFPSDDAPETDVVPSSPQPPGFSGQKSPDSEAFASQAEMESSAVTFDYDPDHVDRKYELLNLKVIHRRRRTGFEETKDFPIRVNDLVAGRYQVMDFLGSAAFSKAVQALDTKTGMLVCLKIIKNNKDYFDQSLDEIKLLTYINEADPEDEHGMLRLFDYFYYKEHLFLVCELLRANLYEFQKYNRENGDEPYFTLPHLQRIAHQVLRSIAFLHSLDLIHSDLKPENILVKSYSRCEVKVIDLGSSCFISDHLSSYVQSRSYRAPEVILGLPYDQKIDIWSFGCILAELLTGSVLFQNDSLSTLLARLEGILGPLPQHMVRKGRFSHRFYTRQGVIYERSQRTV
ncbi:TPA: hypothetical protein ACH3X1_001498 [Trebouxia sp. C0004]